MINVIATTMEVIDLIITGMRIRVNITDTEILTSYYNILEWNQTVESHYLDKKDSRS